MDDIEIVLDKVLDKVLDTVQDVDKNDDIIQKIWDFVTLKNRTIILGDVDANTTGVNVYQSILVYNYLDKDKPIEDREPIKLYIDSYGGSIIDAMTIIDVIKASKTPVHIYVIGAAYSSGLFITLAGHKRYAYPHASFLLHEGSIGTGIQDAHKFKKYSEFYFIQLKQIKEHIIEHSKITAEEYDTISKDDNWYTAQQALEKGFIDEIIG